MLAKYLSESLKEEASVLAFSESDRERILAAVLRDSKGRRGRRAAWALVALVGVLLCTSTVIAVAATPQGRKIVIMSGGAASPRNASHPAAPSGNQGWLFPGAVFSSVTTLEEAVSQSGKSPMLEPASSGYRLVRIEVSKATPQHTAILRLTYARDAVRVTVYEVANTAPSEQPLVVSGNLPVVKRSIGGQDVALVGGDGTSIAFWATHDTSLAAQFEPPISPEQALGFAGAMR